MIQLHMERKGYQFAFQHSLHLNFHVVALLSFILVFLNVCLPTSSSRIIYTEYDTNNNMEGMKPVVQINYHEKSHKWVISERTSPIDRVSRVSCRRFVIDHHDQIGVHHHHHQSDSINNNQNQNNQNYKYKTPQTMSSVRYDPMQTRLWSKQPIAFLCQCAITENYESDMWYVRDDQLDISLIRIMHNCNIRIPIPYVDYQHIVHTLQHADV